MAALTIDLDDDASSGLDAINSKLDEMSGQTDRTAKSVEALTESQQRELLIVQKQTVGISTLVNTGVPALAKLGETGIRAFAGIETSTERMVVAAIPAIAELGVQGIKTFGEIGKAAVGTANTVVKEGASVAKWVIGTGAAVKGLSIIFGEHEKAVKKSADATDEASDKQERFLGLSRGTLAFLGLAGTAAVGTAAKYGLLGEVAESAAKKAGLAMYGLGGYAAGVGIAVKGLEAIFDRTGIKYKGMTEDISKQTKAQADGFKKFKDEANSLGLSLDDLAQSRGIQDVNKYLEEAFGVKTVEKYETNLDRIKTAFGELGGELSQTAQDVREGFGAWYELTGITERLNKAWNEVDKDITMRADNLVENLGLMRKGFRGLVDDAIDFKSAMEGEEGGFGAKRMREARLESERLQKTFAETADDFARIRVFNAQADKADADRAENARVNSLKTRNAIVAELQAMDQRRGMLAANNQFTEAEAKRMFAVQETLKSRLMAIDQKEAEAKARYHQVFVDQANVQAELLSDRYKHSKELYDLETKRLGLLAGFQKDLNKKVADHQVDIGVGAAKEQHETEKQIAAERMKVQGATESQIKTQLFQMDKQFAQSVHSLKMDQIRKEFQENAAALKDQQSEIERSELSQAEKSKRIKQLEMDAEKLIFETKKKQLDETAKFAKDSNSREFSEKRQLELQKWQVEKERLDKVKQENEQAAQRAMQHIDTKQLLNNADPAKVRKQLMDDRAKAAAQAQMERDQELGEKGLGGDQAAARKWMENQRKAMNRAKRQAADDFDNGNVGEGELQKSQAEVGKQTIQNLGAQGKINQSTTRALTDILTTLANQQQAAQNTDQTLQAILDALRGIKSTAKASVSNSRAQQGALL